MEGQVIFRKSLELWLIRDKLVASQESYSYPYMKDTWRENRYFYCRKCGEVWGKRLDVGAESPSHYYIKSTCQNCGGLEDMRYPWEETHPEVHSASVLAHLLMIYTTDPEVYNETATIND